MKVYLDDVRQKPKDYDYLCHNLLELLELIAQHGCPNFISFDHDLGHGEFTGMDVAKYLVTKDIERNKTFLPQDFNFVVHSANPVGAKNIAEYLTNYLNYRKN